MKLLLDTCAFLWFQAGSPELSDSALSAILDPSNEVYLSAVSVWEIARKYARGWITLPEPPSTLIPTVRDASGIASLPLTERDALEAERLPMWHKHPFDRMLIAQAMVREMALVSADGIFERYAVRLLW